MAPEAAGNSGQRWPSRWLSRWLADMFSCTVIDSCSSFGERRIPDLPGEAGKAGRRSRTFSRVGYLQ